MEKEERSCRVVVEQMSDEEVRYALNHLASILDSGEMPNIFTYDIIFNPDRKWRDRLAA